MIRPLFLHEKPKSDLDTARTQFSSFQIRRVFFSETRLVVRGPGWPSKKKPEQIRGEEERT